MENTAIVSWVSLGVAVGGIILGVINHKRIRSRCCGKTLEAALDIENTTPVQQPPYELKAGVSKS